MKIMISWHNGFFIDMLKMSSHIESSESLPSSGQSHAAEGQSASADSPEAVQSHNERSNGLFSRLKKAVFPSDEKSDQALREAIEEYIVEPEGFDGDSVSTHERILFSNVLKLRDIKVVDAMIPRADIVALDVETPKEDLLKFLSEQQYSRLPVYQDTLDDVLGTIHLKDIVAAIASNAAFDLRALSTEAPIVSPAMPVLDLVLKMRQSSRHMALVIDEFGGIDGLVTIGDVIERIIGEIDDEHDTQEEPEFTENSDGSVHADARVSLEDFEKRYGAILHDKDREESDTLGGLIFDLAGRVPVRGEVITHQNGMVFKILDAAPRRINSLKITNIPVFSEIADDAE